MFTDIWSEPIDEAPIWARVVAMNHVWWTCPATCTRKGARHVTSMSHACTRSWAHACKRSKAFHEQVMCMHTVSQINYHAKGARYANRHVMSMQHACTSSLCTYTATLTNEKRNNFHKNVAVICMQIKIPFLHSPLHLYGVHMMLVVNSCTRKTWGFQYTPSMHCIFEGFICIICNSYLTYYCIKKASFA